MALKIGTIGGKAFTLPADLVTQTAAVLAKKGSGKSYTAAVMAEELLDAGQQVVIIDPTGAHWGLRSSADGKSAGFPIVVVGGDHADLPLEEGAGEILARAVVERRFSAILDVSLLRKGAATRFLGAFFEALYRLNRAPLHLICDEADVYAPQKPFAEEARTLGAIEDIVRRGRIRGIGCTLITQRPAVLSKNVLTQAELLIALRVAHPKDIDAIMEWVNVHGDPKQAEKMVESLPSLPIGTAWFWSPGWGDIFERVQVRARRTFDSGATPKAGQAVKAPKVLAEIDVEKLGAEIKATVEKAKADDPAELKRTIAQLRKDLTAAQASKPAPTVKVSDSKSLTLKAELSRYRRALEAAVKIIVKVKAIDFDLGSVNSQAALEQAITAAVSQVTAPIEKRVAALVGRVDGMKEQAAAAEAAINALLNQTVDVTLEVQKSAPYTVRAPAQRQQSPAPQPRQRHDPASLVTFSAAGERLPPGELATLKACAQYHDGCRREQLSILTGYKRSSRDAYIARLAQRGFVSIQGELVLSTSDGRTALGADYEPLPTGEDLQRYWLERLPPGEKAVLEVALQAYPKAVTRDSIGEATTYKRSSRDAYIARLAARQVITAGRGEIRASEVLFT